MAKQKETTKIENGNSYFNLIVGIVVVVAIGALVIGLIRGRNVPQTQKQEEKSQETTSQTEGLPTKHVVAEGEDLWKISEKYYKTGYNWTDIADANNLTNNPNAITVGMELTIPNVTPKMSETPTTEPTSAQAVEPSAAPTAEPTQAPEVKNEQTSSSENAISSDSYTVNHGDSLWTISVRAYGDGYKWVDIARVNKLENPNIIHSGNILTLPR